VKKMTEQGVRKLIAAEAKKAGSLRTLSWQWEVSMTLLWKTARGNCPPGPKILECLGLERRKRIDYVRMDPGESRIRQSSQIYE
jgi:hypothetical protein